MIAGLVSPEHVQSVPCLYRESFPVPPDNESGELIPPTLMQL